MKTIRIITVKKPHKKAPPPQRYFSDLPVNELLRLAARIGRQPPQEDYLSQFTWVRLE